MSDTPPLNTSNVLSLSVHPEPAAKAFWTPEDESALINHLIDRKAEAGDGANFKGDVWNGAAKEMEGYTTKGGVKTAAACKSKWTRVRRYFLSLKILLISIDLLASLKKATTWSLPSRTSLDTPGMTRRV
jgi:hypothetical protein